MSWEQVLRSFEIAVNGAVEWGAVRTERFVQSASASGQFNYDGNAALLLLAGGLTILTFTVPLALVRARLSRRHEQRPARSIEFDEPRRLQASLPSPGEMPLEQDPAFLEGMSTGRDAVDEGAGLDAALDAVKAAELGKPRIRTVSSQRLVVELVGCDGCPAPELAHVGRAIAPHGCAYETGMLEGALRTAHDEGTRVREIECAGWGDDACVFEVRR